MGKATLGIATLTSAIERSLLYSCIAMGKATLGIATFWAMKSFRSCGSLHRDGKGHFGYCDEEGAETETLLAIFIIAMGKATLGIATMFFPFVGTVFAVLGSRWERSLWVLRLLDNCRGILSGRMIAMGRPPSAP